jgi:hypothetical protein
MAYENGDEQKSQAVRGLVSRVRVRERTGPFPTTAVGSKAPGIEASILQLQRLVGNQSVNSLLAFTRKQTSPATDIIAMVQRCGSIACGCHAGKRVATDKYGVATVQREDDDDSGGEAGHEDPLVGPDRAVDSQDKACSITFDSAGHFKSVSCDPSVTMRLDPHLNWNEHGQPLKFPSNPPWMKGRSTSPPPGWMPKPAPGEPNGLDWLRIKGFCPPDKQDLKGGACCGEGFHPDYGLGGCAVDQPAGQNQEPGDYPLPPQDEQTA